jgi:hypothetical protein
MKSIFILALTVLSTFAFSQGRGYEYYIMNSEVDEFDVLGNDAYETNLSLDNNITQKLEVEVGSDAKAPETDGNSFIAKNTIDGNMKTAWLTPDGGKNTLIEFVVDLEEVEGVNGATLFQIALFNGWRKDYQTWKDYSRVKKVALIINDKPYAEVTLEDTYKMQYIDLEKMKLDKVRRYRFKFRIMETYPGKKFEQTGFSDVQFIGKIK